MASLVACRDAPARDMRRIEGANVEMRAIGLPPPPEAALNAAFAAVTALDGAATDRAVAVLRAAGARKALVNLGGDHLAVFGEPLVVAVPDPDDLTRPRWASFSLRDGALSREARAGEGAILSITVVTARAAHADDVVAAARALPPDEAVALIHRRGTAGFVLTREGAERWITTTPGFAATHELRTEEGVRVRP